MRIVVKMSETLEDGSVSIKKRKKDKKERWKWDEQKSERFLEVFKSFKRQKLGEVRFSSSVSPSSIKKIHMRKATI